MLSIVKKAMDQAQEALTALRADETTLRAIAAAGELLAASFRAHGRAFSCGNGGSMCDAMHFAEELSGKFRRERRALAAVAIADAAHLSCVANDFGFDQVFARYITAHGRPGDVLLAISTSGKSSNILKAAEAARAQGLKVIALTGRRDSPLHDLADVVICTPGGTPWSDRVQELHIKVIHTLIELTEVALFGGEQA